MPPPQAATAQVPKEGETGSYTIRQHQFWYNEMNDAYRAEEGKQNISIPRDSIEGALKKIASGKNDRIGKKMIWLEKVKEKIEEYLIREGNPTFALFEDLTPREHIEEGDWDAAARSLEKWKNC